MENAIVFIIRNDEFNGNTMIRTDIDRNMNNKKKE